MVQLTLENNQQYNKLFPNGFNTNMVQLTPVKMVKKNKEYTT